MYVTKYGTLLGDIPAAMGKTFFVSPTAAYTINGETFDASNDNDGLSPTTGVSSIARAIALATANVGDVIVLMPGNHTSATVVNINKAGLTFVGLNPQFRDRQNFRPRAATSKVNWTSTLAGTAVALSVADTTFIGINMIPVTARTFMTAVTCPRTTFIDCAVTLSAAASTSTKGVVASGGSSAYCSFVNCEFINTVATSAQGPALDLTGMGQVVMEKCRILLTGTSSAWAVAIQCGSGTSGIFEANLLSALGVGTMTIGIDGTGVIIANSVIILDGKVGVSPGAGAYKNFDADSAAIVTNYLGTVSGGSGGTLSTVAI